MKNIGLLISFCVWLLGSAEAQVTKNEYPLPSAAQVRWQMYENIMFIHLSPATWQGREYDDWSSSVEDIRLSKLNTDQWCEVAHSWGAKMILFVAKHAGGFCWWQTETSDYGIKNTPWKRGKGDVLWELSRSCKKYALDLGVYVYPGDEQWGAGIGSGGRTKDPAKQAEYNRIYRQQLTEVLTKYGPMREVWFDGNCYIPVEDLLAEYASDAVILQSKSANIRWVGNEDGYAPYPNWYTVNEADLKTGVSTALHSNVNGNVYAPVEADVPFLKNKGHKWFWAPNTEHLIPTQDQLMNLYYHSVGRGSVLLMNATPDTSGMIPRSHVEVYAAFGKELEQRFEKPIKSSTSTGNTLELSFAGPTAINHSILQEELPLGQRIMEYVLEGSEDGKNWNQLCTGSSVGNKKIDYFPTVVLLKIRLRVLKAKDTPHIRNFAVYNVKSTLDDISRNQKEKPLVIGHWEADTYSDGEWKDLELDLTPHVNSIGQYDITFSTLAYDFTNTAPTGLEFSDWRLEMYGEDGPQNITQLAKNATTFRITRSQQTLDEYRTILRLKVKRKPSKSSGEITIKRLTY